jgi:hypothetical protein
MPADLKLARAAGSQESSWAPELRGLVTSVAPHSGDYR